MGSIWKGESFWLPELPEARWAPKNKPFYLKAAISQEPQGTQHACQLSKYLAFSPLSTHECNIVKTTPPAG